MLNSKDSKTFLPIVHVQIMNYKISPLCHAINFHPPSLLVGKGKGYGGLSRAALPLSARVLLFNSRDAVWGLTPAALARRVITRAVIKE